MLSTALRAARAPRGVESPRAGPFTNSFVAPLRTTIVRCIPAVLTFLVCLLAWELGVRAFHVPLYLLPPPSLVVAYIAGNQALFVASTLETVRLVLEGFAISILLGIPLGVLLARSRLFARTVYPLLVASQTFPKLAVGPLFVVWFGFGSTPKLLLAFLVAFFPIMIDATTGLRSVRPETLMLARSMGLGRTRTFFRIQLPQALPSIFAGLRIGSTLSVLGVLVAEFLGAAGGLGYLVITATGSLNTVLLFSALVVIAVIGLVLYGAVALIERLAIGSWYPGHAKETDS
jgi:NitT/TauT family transport system permease protein